MRLSFKTGGIVRRIAVLEGQEVKRGQVLAEIELGEIGASVEQARQAADKAQRDLARGESLYADQVISLEQLQDLRTQASVAAAQLSAARFNLGYSVITAPRDGIVLRRFVEERELVPAGQPVVALGAREGGYVVKAALADREIVQVSIGDTVEVRLDAFPDRTLPGTVVEASRAADERSRLFPIEVRIDSTPLPLASGLVAKLAIQPARTRTETLLYAPLAAIVEGDRDRASVFLVAAGKAKRQPVRIAFITNGAAALAEGLAEGDQVVTDGALYLEDGEAVRVLAPDDVTTAAR
jgi:RND family efflux transporter MFP subunit